MKKTLLAVDGNSLMHRAFWALPQMNDSKGRPTNALYGFLNMFFSLITQYHPDYIIVAFDKKGKTFRHDFFPEYKAGRRSTPPELNLQFTEIKSILNQIGIQYAEIDNYEADDIIGAVSLSSDCQNYLVTGDKDYLQLVSDNTTVLLTRKGISETEIFTPKHLNDVYGLNPEQIIDLKALMGDSSDNIPGIPGIGEKTALKILHEFGTINNLYSNIDLLPKGKLKEKIINGKDSALLSYRLATISSDIPDKINLQTLAFKDFNHDNLRDIFIDYNFSSLMKKFSIDGDSFSVTQISTDIQAIKDLIINNKEIAVYISDEAHFSFDSETDYIVHIRKTLLDDGYDLSEILEVLRNIDSKLIIFYDVKKFMHESGIRINNYFDLGIASWVINPTSFPSSFENMCSMSNLPVSSSACFILYKKYSDIIEKNNLHCIFYDIELPLVSVLYSMENEGLYIDTDKLKVLQKKYSEKINSIAYEIYQYAGHPFNIASPKQLGTVLFEELGLPVIKKNKNGFSTDAAVLEKLEDFHPIISCIKEHRLLSKMLGTYIEGLLNAEKNGKIHTTFLQTSTATGRLSSIEPNLQNIPVRSELSQDIRQAFYAPDDYLILSADYSQIELRILAHISSDNNLIDAFNNNEDIHARTASQILHKSINDVTPEERSAAKAVNFGIVYGISDFGLAKNTGISVKKAGLYIQNYLNEFSGIAGYMDEIKKSAHEKGYVRTLWGRIRYIPELSNSNYNIRSFGERAALNTPIQGTAADIIKLAMIKVFDELRIKNLKSKLILQVHDELLVYVYKDELETVSELIHKIMTNIAELSVPLDIHISKGKYWSEAK